jgi:hypothetical protein
MLSGCIVNRRIREIHGIHVFTQVSAVDGVVAALEEEVGDDCVVFRQELQGFAGALGVRELHALDPREGGSGCREVPGVVVDHQDLQISHMIRWVVGNFISVLDRNSPTRSTPGFFSRGWGVVG